MKIDLDKHQILYYLEGCARGSHLRQGCWHDMIRLYPEMPESYRAFLYTYAKRDIAPIFNRQDPLDGLRPCGADDFDQFLDCFNPDNRYQVTATKEGKTRTEEAYLHRGHFYTNPYFYFEEEYITNIEKL